MVRPSTGLTARSLTTLTTLIVAMPVVFKNDAPAGMSAPHHATWRPRTFDGTPVVAVEELDFAALPTAKHAPEWTTSGHAHWEIGWVFGVRLDCAQTLRDLQ